MRQLWRHLGFFHWPVDPDQISAVLPPGIEVDTFDGVAYLGLVPFTMLGTRPPFLPALPGFSDFHEVNVRTYVHAGGRDPGVWFFSLDASSSLAVAGARAVYKLPYFHASIAMTVQQTSRDVIDFRSSRDSAAQLTCVYQPTGEVRPAQPDTLEFFLIERYLLYAWDGRRLRTARVFHQPYPLQTARLGDGFKDTLVAQSGVARPDGPPPLAHYAREVDVRIYRPRLNAHR
jgi:uncharacterized protein YqjF (DUF2071 family)